MRAPFLFQVTFQTQRMVAEQLLKLQTESEATDSFPGFDKKNPDSPHNLLVDSFKLDLLTSRSAYSTSIEGVGLCGVWAVGGLPRPIQHTSQTRTPGLVKFDAAVGSGSYSARVSCPRLTYHS